MSFNFDTLKDVSEFRQPAGCDSLNRFYRVLFLEIIADWSRIDCKWLIRRWKGCHKLQINQKPKQGLPKIRSYVQQEV